MPQTFFKASKDEMLTIVEIAKRTELLAQSIGVNYKRLDIIMDLNACHSNGCPLKLAELASADESNFAHDVFGIRRHIDRTTGELRDCFLPRYAAI
jgi:hypothetical protein